MLIGLAGRKGCGKTTISDILVNEYGFKKASFAAALKEYTAELFNWDIEDLQTQEGKESLLQEPVVWDAKACDRLSGIVGIKLVFEEERLIKTRREALQFVGTDVLRKADENFHVNEFKKRFSEGNFVCDDLRFPNEHDTLKEVGAICVFLIRPYYWEYSNHASEISLRRHQFDYVFLNDDSEYKFTSKFKAFLDNLLVECTIPISRDDLICLLERNDWDVTKCGWSSDQIILWTTKYMINLPIDEYTINEDVFAVISPGAAYWANILSTNATIEKNLLHLTSINLDLIVRFKEFLQYNKPIDGDNYITVSSRFIIDDLKLWNFVPN
jgi:hypothetical protein